LGYFSNWLNWRFLNYKINHLLYYFGAFVHESSHAILCILTGAKITQFKVFNEQPRVVYTNPKLPILGNLFISIAPLFGGLALLFLTQKYFLLNQYIMPVFSDWHFFISDFLNFIKQINLFDWRNLITIFFLLNIGAMISPSWKDLKNVWILIIILLFIPWAFFSHMGLLAITLILMNLIIQLALILLISIFRLF
jgi:hypothetical protein